MAITKPPAGKPTLKFRTIVLSQKLHDDEFFDVDELELLYQQGWTPVPGSTALSAVRVDLFFHTHAVMTITLQRMEPAAAPVTHEASTMGGRHAG